MSCRERHRLRLHDAGVEPLDIPVVDALVALQSAAMLCGIMGVQPIDVTDDRAGNRVQLTRQVHGGQIRAASPEKHDPVS